MDKRGLRRTLMIYLAYSLLISSSLAIVILLAEYRPSTQKAIERIGIGAIVLNSILWCLLFTVAGSTSLFNQVRVIQASLLLSFLSFTFFPFLAGFVIIKLSEENELFGFLESYISFLLSHCFFFLKFRSCVKNQPAAID
jgi:hypothetical protein